MDMSRSVEINHNNIESFETFFQGWLLRLEQYLEELIQAIQWDNDTGSCEENEARQKELIDKVLAHYADYHAAKARVAQENVFLLFSATWLSSYERIFLWISGFRPSLACRFSSNAAIGLTEDQSTRINSLTAQVKEEEIELTNAHSRIQEAMVSPEVVALAMGMRRLQNGASVNVESVTHRLRTSMEALVECADYLREKTIVKILEILSSPQKLKFLAKAANFQLNVRRYGLQRDANGPS